MTKTFKLFLNLFDLLVNAQFVQTDEPRISKPIITGDKKNGQYFRTDTI